jgi:peptidoglycan/LPS O-acetylase OafA/YrhL
MTSTIIRPATQDRSGDEPARLTYRPALDGLRAIAVIAVIIYHLDAPWLPGGFLGVDLFFVLSGTLITALLLLELETRGGIDRWRFWARRLRRLLPAVLVLMAVVVPLARADIGIRGDALATLGYVANWRFAELARSYFSETAAMSVLNHMWSLAIEEQFYIVWPLFVALLGRRRRLMVAVMVVLVVASAACMIWLYSPSDPSQAYYHTFARAHELVIGALIAVPLISTAPWAARMRRIARRLLPLAAVGIAVAFATVVDNAAPYYFGVSLLFSMAVAVVILGIEDDPAAAAGRALAWRPLVWVGTLSYGLYLWHWPLVVFARRQGLDGVPLWFAVLTLTVAAAWLSARFVEEPIRRGRLLRRELTPRRSVVTAAAAVVVMAVMMVAVTPASLQPAWAQAEAGQAPQVVTGGDASGDGSASADGGAVSTDERAFGPGDDGARTVGDATGPPVPRNLVIGMVGDSAAASMVPGLSVAADARDHTLVSAAARGCPMTPELQVDPEGAPLRYSDDCLEHVRTAFETLVEAHDPDVVLWYSSRDTENDFLVDDSVVAPGTPAHTAIVEEGFDDAVEQLTAGGAELVIIRSLPRHGNVIGPCSRPPGPGTDWCGDIERIAGTGGQNLLYERVVDRHPDVHLISVADVVCGTGRECDDGMTDDQTWRTDLTHFGEEGAERIGEVIMRRALWEALPGSVPRASVQGEAVPATW